MTPGHKKVTPGHKKVTLGRLTVTPGHKKVPRGHKKVPRGGRVDSQCSARVLINARNSLFMYVFMHVRIVHLRILSIYYVS